MNQFEITAEARTDTGKGPNRRLRRDGKLPGVIYGAKKKPVSIALNQNELIQHLEHEAFYSHILTLLLGKKKEKVVLKSLQRHPYKKQILHIDLLRVDASKELTMQVPLHFINENTCVGVKHGGIVSHVMTELEISCLPKYLPEYIAVDLAEINLGESVHLGDLVMPKGVRAAALAHGGDVSQPIVTVHLPRIAQEPEEEEAPAEEIAIDKDTPTQE